MKSVSDVIIGRHRCLQLAITASGPVGRHTASISLSGRSLSRSLAAVGHDANGLVARAAAAATRTTADQQSDETSSKLGTGNDVDDEIHRRVENSENVADGRVIVVPASAPGRVFGAEDGPEDMIDERRSLASDEHENDHDQRQCQILILLMMMLLLLLLLLLLVLMMRLLRTAAIC